jgi:hypothetical protein
MGRAEPPDESPDPEVESVRTLVPGRAVLTELARGFLLVHQSNPDRAVRFAEGFLKECAVRDAELRVDASRPVTDARRRLGRIPSGAVDPSNFPPVR